MEKEEAQKEKNIKDLKEAIHGVNNGIMDLHALGGMDQYAGLDADFDRVLTNLTASWQVIMSRLENLIIPTLEKK